MYYLNAATSGTCVVGGFRLSFRPSSMCRVHFLHQGHQQSAVVPQLICLDGSGTGGRIERSHSSVHLSAITDVVMTLNCFVRNSHITRIFRTEIHSGPAALSIYQRAHQGMSPAPVR